MAKTSQELATEITVAWLNAVSSPLQEGKLNSSWLQLQNVSDFYTEIVKTINETYNL